MQNKWPQALTSVAAAGASLAGVAITKDPNCLWGLAVIYLIW